MCRCSAFCTAILPAERLGILQPSACGSVGHSIHALLGPGSKYLPGVVQKLMLCCSLRIFGYCELWATDTN